jgi:hypothetical protein
MTRPIDVDPGTALRRRRRRAPSPRRPQLLHEHRAYDANFGSRLDTKVFVKARTGVSAASARAALVAAAASYPGVKVLDRAAYKTEQTKVLN